MHSILSGSHHLISANSKLGCGTVWTSSEACNSSTTVNKPFHSSILSVISEHLSMISVLAACRLVYRHRHSAITAFITLLILAGPELKPSSGVFLTTYFFTTWLFYYKIVICEAQCSCLKVTSGFIFTFYIYLPACTVRHVRSLMARVVGLFLVYLALLLLLCRKLLEVRLFLILSR